MTSRQETSLGRPRKRCSGRVPQRVLYGRALVAGGVIIQPEPLSCPTSAPLLPFWRVIVLIPCCVARNLLIVSPVAAIIGTFLNFRRRCFFEAVGGLRLPLLRAHALRSTRPIR